MTAGSSDEYVFLVEKLTALRKLRSKILNEINANLKDMNSRDFYVLHKICKKDSTLTMSNLSVITGLSNALITSAIDNLEKKKLVKRKRGPDRRSYFIGLTKKGEEQCQELNKLRKNSIEGFFKNMSREDIEELRDVLQRLNELVDKYI